MPTMNNRGLLFLGSAFGSSPGGAMAPAKAEPFCVSSLQRLRRFGSSPGGGNAAHALAADVLFNRSVLSSVREGAICSSHRLGVELSIQL
jgi:hypothetical protein